jgi:mRNA-degrading endonuclease RelE of RelBE toxin-antitoxin system
MISVVFVETGLFTRLLPDYLSDEEYRGLQSYLIAHPDAGPVIKASGGVRKIRWRSGGKGKSGGIRIIYYWAKAANQVFLLTMYRKGEKEDLSSADLEKIVRLLAELDR